MIFMDAIAPLWFWIFPSLPSMCKRRPLGFCLIGRQGRLSCFFHKEKNCCPWSIGIYANLQITFVEDKHCRCLYYSLFPFLPLILFILSATTLYCATFHQWGISLKSNYVSSWCWYCFQNSPVSPSFNSIFHMLFLIFLEGTWWSVASQHRMLIFPQYQSRARAHH